MSQVLLTSKDVQDNINNNNVADFVHKSRSEGQHVSRNGPMHLGNSSMPLQIMGVTNFDSSKSAVWRTIPPSSQTTPSSSQHDNNNRGRVAKIEEGLDNSVGPEAKIRINRILNEVNSLSDVEKLLLYLKLPTGTGCGEDGSKQSSNSSQHMANRVEQGQAYTWIKSHLQEDQEICLPKQEVFEEYRAYCENHGLKCLSTADFGKVMKCVFPNIKPRRLGQRGQSKYCYSGLRKKLEVEPPSLPELEVTSTVNENETTPSDGLFTASCDLVCEWAQKLLGQNFTDLRQLAEFLLGNLYVNSKSMSAFSVLAAMQESPGPPGKGNISQLFTNPAGGNKHRETQLQLQRKLQERELIKEQKRKLQLQKSEIEQEQEQSRAGSSSERELSTPSLVHGRSSERELDTPSLSLRTSCTTPFDDMTSPSRSSVSCSPVGTPSRADSVENRRTASETEFVSPVAIRATYRRRNSQGAAEKERRKREKASSLTSPFFEAARNLLEGTRSLDRQLFVETDDYLSDRDPRSNQHVVSANRKPDPMRNSTDIEISHAPNDFKEVMDSRSSSSRPVSVVLTNLEKSKDPSTAPFNMVSNHIEKSKRVNQLPQPVQHVPLIPSRSAFVPFPQRIIGSVTQGPLTPDLSPSSVQPDSTSASTNVSMGTNQKSRGLTRLLMSKPRKDVGIVEALTKGQLAQPVTYTVGSSAGKDSLLSIQPAPVIRSSPREVNNNQRSDLTVVTPSSSPSVENSPGVTSPGTPRRAKTRFTPIRPKAPAPRTVSSMLREQRGPIVTIEGTSFGSKPVAEILKEKRERETLIVPLSPAAGTSATQSVPSVQVAQKLAIPAQIPIVNPVVSTVGELQRSTSLSNSRNPNELFIIMGASPGSGSRSHHQIASVKAKRSNTISIPIAHKDLVAAQLKGHHVKAGSNNVLSANHMIRPMLAAVQNLSDNECRMETDENVTVLESTLNCKRKRKSPGSAKELSANCSESVINANAVNADENHTLTDTDECLEDNSDENNPKRSKSCLPHLENHDIADSTLVEDRVPDITSLESDALVDMPLSAAELASSLGTDSSTFEYANCQATTMKTASVGVTSHSMKLSHKLMRQSLQLDKRIDTFLKQRSRPKTNPSESTRAEDNRQDDILVMMADYSHTAKYKSANRTASDTKLNLKPSSSGQEKARSTVHRGVVQTSNSFVVKKPLASKGSTKDHFLLKLLTGDSSSAALSKPSSKSKELPAISSLGDIHKKRANPVLQTCVEPRAAIINRPNFLDDLDSMLSKSDSLPQDMDLSGESELPTDVADFITESMEKRSSNIYLHSQSNAFNISDFQPQGLGLQSLGDPFQLHHSTDLSAEILSSQIPVHHSQDALFTVPSVPPTTREPKQRRNTPVMRSVSVPASAASLAQQLSLINTSTAFLHENTDSSEPMLTSISRPMLLRLNSNERHGAQTPISDAGYHSFDSSPVPSTTPLPIHLSQVPNNEINPSPMSTEHHHHLSVQTQPPSPMHVVSPKPQPRSTPISFSSAHVHRHSSETSPVEVVSTQSRFMPIGGSGLLQEKLNLINPIKPTVTLASSGIFSSQLVSPKAIDSVTSVRSVQSFSAQKPISISAKSSQRSQIKSPPSYQDAIQSLQCQTPTLSNNNIDPNINLSSLTEVDYVKELSDSKQVEIEPGQNDEKNMLNAGISAAVFPFSYQLSLLRSKSSDSGETGEEETNDTKVSDSNMNSPMSGSTCSEYSNMSFQSAAETEQVEFQNVATLIKHYHASARQQVEKRKQAVLLPQVLLAQIPEQRQFVDSSQCTGSTNKHHFDLPDARYMGSTPNVDIRHLLSDGQDIPQCKVRPKLEEGTAHVHVQSLSANQPLDIRSLLEVKLACNDDRNSQLKNGLIAELDNSDHIARRNFSQILSGSVLGEDDLQSTLDDLKSFDTQYFGNIPINAGVDPDIPEDMQDLRPLDLNSAEQVSLEMKHDGI